MNKHIPQSRKAIDHRRHLNESPFEKGEVGGRRILGQRPPGDHYETERRKNPSPAPPNGPEWKVDSLDDEMLWEIMRSGEIEEARAEQMSKQLVKLVTIGRGNAKKNPQ